MSGTKGSKIVKAVGFLAFVGILIAVGRLIFKGIRKSEENIGDDAHAEKETHGV